jgi:hypothetical protein
MSNKKRCAIGSAGNQSIASGHPVEIRHILGEGGSRHV